MTVAKRAIRRPVSDAVLSAAGRWPETLARLGIDVPARNQHGPCPVCGGKDRFRFDDKEGRGTWFCNQCDPKAGDGLELVMRATGKSAMKAAKLVAGVLGIHQGEVDVVELEQLRCQRQAITEAENKQKEQKRRKAAHRAACIIADCRQAESLYLVAKGLRNVLVPISQHVIVVGEQIFSPGSLVVPLTVEPGGELVTVQLIDENGSKAYLPGGQKAGAFYCIAGGELVIVCEGFATGLSIHQATGATIYCAMDAGNLLAVARLVRGIDGTNQTSQIILCADNDAHTEGNTGKAKAEEAAAAVGSRVVMPPEAGDWNDYHQAHGLDVTKQEIMSQINKTQDQSASQKEGASSATVIPLRPEASQLDVMLDKMSANQRAALLIGRLGTMAVNSKATLVYRYMGSAWEQMADDELRREMAAICEEHGGTFSNKMLSGVVATMKDMIPKMPVSRDDVIGFANGVYDLANSQFRPHSPTDGLINHNGIVYGEPQTGESLESHAPNYTKWLSHAAESSAAKMERINAALYMVLANRYDWQLFLEMTGDGGTGKSVLANLCELLVGGRNVGSNSMKRLESDFGLESVWDKRLILLPDQPKYVGDGATLKAITGGDMVAINPKGKAAFSAKVRAVVLATNNEPMVMTERNGGIARRRVIFPFNNVVADADKDPQLIMKIAAELPVIIRHLLTRFAEPESARTLLLEQRNSTDALAVKRSTDPVIDFCAVLTFMSEPEGLFMGGNPELKREPRRYLYHAYLTYLEFNGLGRPLSVQGFVRAIKAAAKEHGAEYDFRTINGRSQTNVMLTDEAAQFLP